MNVIIIIVNEFNKRSFAIIRSILTTFVFQYNNIRDQISRIRMKLKNEVMIHNLMYDTEKVCDELLNQTRKDVKRLNETEYLKRLQWVDDSLFSKERWCYDFRCFDRDALDRTKTIRRCVFGSLSRWPIVFNLERRKLLLFS